MAERLGLSGHDFYGWMRLRLGDSGKKQGRSLVKVR